MDKWEKEAWLREEVSEWLEEGIIEERQAIEILHRYGLSKAPSEEKAPNLISMISIMGSVLIGLGAILFVASNWSALPQLIRFLLLFFVTFGTYYAGWILRYSRRSHPRVGEGLLFLASIFMGATIFLTAQIFNVNANAHWLLLLWFLAISPLGYGFCSKPILGLNIVTFLFWIITYLGLQRLDIAFMFYLLMGISLYGLGMLHTMSVRFSQFRILYQSFGLFIILASYFYFSVEAPYRFQEIIEANWAFKVILLFFAATTFGTILTCALRWEKFQTVRSEFFLLVLAFLGWTTIAALNLFWHGLTRTTTSYGYTYTELNPDISTALFVIFNLIFFVLTIGSILIGYHKSEVYFVNLGLIFFASGILHLYLTTVYAYLPRSLAFMVGGVILLLGGWRLEKMRRSIVQKMKVEGI